MKRPPSLAMASHPCHNAPIGGRLSGALIQREERRRRRGRRQRRCRRAECARFRMIAGPTPELGMSYVTVAFSGLA
jgi:hypothetical protein